MADVCFIAKPRRLILVFKGQSEVVFHLAWVAQEAGSEVGSKYLEKIREILVCCKLPKGRRSSVNPPQ